MRHTVVIVEIRHVNKHVQQRNTNPLSSVLEDTVPQTTPWDSA